jgi:glycine reductase
MVKELERAGIPTTHVCTIVPISLTVGANRIVPAVAIPHPLGNPSLTKEQEKALRKRLVLKALKALTQDVDRQTVFED